MRTLIGLNERGRGSDIGGKDAQAGKDAQEDVRIEAAGWIVATLQRGVKELTVVAMAEVQERDGDQAALSALQA